MWCKSGGLGVAVRVNPAGALDRKATGGFLWCNLKVKGGTQPMANVRIALRDLLRK